MATSKKPRKAYRKKLVMQPLKIRNDWLLEGGVHAAVVALKAGCVTDYLLHDLGSHGMLVQRMAPAGSVERMHADSLLRVVADVLTRGYANSRDADAVAASVSITLDFLRAQRNHDIARVSMEMVREFDRQRVSA